MQPSMRMSHLSETLATIMTLILAIEDLPIAIKRAYAEAANGYAKADKLEERLKQNLDPELCKQLLSYKEEPLPGQPTIQCERVPPDKKEKSKLTSILDEMPYDPITDAVTIQWHRVRANLIKKAADFSSKTLEVTIQEKQKELDTLLKGVKQEVIDLIVMPSVQVRKSWDIKYDVELEEFGSSYPSEPSDVSSKRKQSRTLVN